MALGPRAFEFLRRHVRERSAVVLDERKLYLFELRLQPLLAAARARDLDALAEAVRADPDGPLGRRVVEAMCTNETSFFRDPRSFEELRAGVLPRLLEARRGERELRIWSAACSSGQEPYSLAITLRERFPELAAWRIEIVATDLSTAMLERARAGVYSQFEVGRGLPARALVEHFEPHGGGWRIRDGLRRWLEFRELNLAQPFTPPGDIDLVFLRNVLIYFDAAARRAVLGRVRAALRPGGVLFLGAAEHALGEDLGLVRDGPAHAPHWRAPARRAA